MNRITLLAVVLLCLAGCAAKSPLPAPPDPALTLRHAIDDSAAIEAQQLAKPDDPGEPDHLARLNHDIEDLKALIDSSQPDHLILIGAHYHLAMAEDAVNKISKRSHTVIDLPLAQDANAHYKTVIGYGKDIPQWSVNIANVLYWAGSNASIYLNSESLASQYWHVCASLGHAGCMNNVAAELWLRPDATRQDLEEAYSLFEKISHTGMQAHCAALYSAMDDAYMAHFHQVARPKGEEFKMLQIARDNFDALQKADKTNDPCSASDLFIEEYLMRADQGEYRPDLIDKFLGISQTPAGRELARYVRGDTKDPETVARLSEGGQTSCGVDVSILWKAIQSRQKRIAQQYFAKIEQLGREKCEVNYDYAQQLIARATPAGG